LHETNELNVEWDGDASAAAKAIADHFNKQGWDAGWFQASDSRRFRAFHVPTGRDIQGRIIPHRRGNGLLARLRPACRKCRVKITIQASDSERQAIESTLLQILKSLEARK
jgi:hypothetical protein